MSDAVRYGKSVRKRAEKREKVVAVQVVSKVDRNATAYTQGEDFDRIMEEVPK
jgi:hypothetical protein